MKFWLINIIFWKSVYLWKCYSDWHFKIIIDIVVHINITLLWTKWYFPFTSKRFAVLVFPGLLDVFTRSFFFMRTFMRLDFHTFDLPTNTTSFRDSKNILSSLIDIDFKNFASVIFIDSSYKVFMILLCIVINKFSYGRTQ